jgi:general secretion pathway protein I
MSGERGFTLIETLVAFSVAVLVLSVLLPALTFGLVGGKRAANVTDATILAESVLDTVGVATALADGDVAELDSGPYHVRTTTQRYVDPAAPSGAGQYVVLYALTATVGWREGGQNRTVSLATLRLAPPRHL